MEQLARKAKVTTRSQTVARTCLLVLGMHRSGTSALTRALSLLGADLPKTLMGGTDGNAVSNPTGHWESEPIAKLNDAILESAGTTWRSSEPFNSAWYETGRFHEFRERALDILENEFDRSSLFVLKDPRVCKLTPFWFSVLSEASIVPRVVSIVRSPYEVAASLFKRNMIERPLGELMWLRYTLDAERDSRLASRVQLSYDQLLRFPSRTLARIGEGLGVVWPRTSIATDEAINSFISSKLRHHVDELAVDGLHDQAVPRVAHRIADTYAILSRWSREGEDQKDWSTLDQVRDEVDSALRLLGEPIYLAFEQTAQIQRLQKLRERLEGELAENAEMIRTLSTASGDRDIARAALAEANRQINNLTAQLEAEIERRRTREDELVRVRLETERHRHDLERELAKQSRLAEDQRRIADDQRRLAKDRQAAIEHLRSDRAMKIAQRDERNAKLQQRVATLEIQHAADLAELRQLKNLRRSSIRRLTKSLGLARAPWNTAARRKHENELTVLRESGLFDPAWYLAKYPDVRGEQIDPAVHYLAHGGTEGRAPSAAFDSRWYLERYPDVCEQGLNPLIHYLEHGRLEGREMRAVQGKSLTTPALSPFGRDVSPVTQTQALARKGASEKPASTSASRSYAQFVSQVALEAPPPAWKAKLKPFTPLAGDGRAACSLVDAIPLGMDETVVTVHGLNVAKRQIEPPLPGESLAACRWFEALVTGQRGAYLPPLADALRHTLRDGCVTLTDAWFANNLLLRLRFDLTTVSGPVVVRAFQSDDAGIPAVCHEASLGSNRFAFVDVPLSNPFRPVLLVLTDGNGLLIDSTLLAFPSLCRNGLHYGELVALTASENPMATICHFSEQLLNCWDGHFALGCIVVDLHCANGSEPIFASSLVDWLTGELGVTISTQPDPQVPLDVTAALAAHFERSPAPLVQREAAMTLILPADAVPSLAALFAPAGSLDPRTGVRFLVTDAQSQSPLYELSFPPPTIGEAALRPSTLPVVPHLVDTSGADEATDCRPAASPTLVALRTSASMTSDTWTLFPVPVDLALPLPPTNPDTIRRLSVVIDCREGHASIGSLFHALANQTGGIAFDCIAVGPAADIGVLAFAEKAGISLRIVPSSEGTIWSRLCKGAAAANGERLLLLDGGIIPHDPRLLASLWALCDLPGVGSAGCVLIHETLDKKGNGFQNRSGGYIASPSHGSANSIFRVADLSAVALPATFPVAAAPMGCLMINRALWQQHGPGEADLGDIPADLRLGLNLLDAGYRNLCAAFITATASDTSVEAPVIEVEGAPAFVVTSFQRYK
jgi:hypothetical protein